MKKILGILTATAVLVSIAATAQAQTVGVQFTPYYGSPYSAINNTNVQNYIPNPAGYQGGAINQQYWNMANNSTGGGDGAPTAPITNSNLLLDDNGTYTSAGTTVQDSTGAANALTFSLSNATQNRGSAGGGSGFTITGGGNSDQWYEANGACPSFIVSGVEASTSSSTPVTLTLGGLNAGDSYNLLVYVGSLNYYGGGQTAAISLGGGAATYLLTDGGTLTNYTQATATSAGSAVTADYVEFEAVSGATLNSEAVTVTGAGTGVSAFQIVDTVPEPSTWAMMVGGFGMLLAGQRIRRSRKN